MRRLLLTLLPKVALSRLCGWLCSIPLPPGIRRRLFLWFSRRYGAALADIDGDVTQFRSLQEFFRRPLRQGARPIAPAALVWPCDGRVLASGAVIDGRLPQIKQHTYALADLLGDPRLAAALEHGSHATIYLAPGDYHRVHAPFAARVLSVRAIPGTLFPVNPPAVACIRDLFVRNSRHVFHCELPHGVPAAVVMVGAYNVGDTRVTVASGNVAPGTELGQFGFGSTTVVIVGPGGPTFATTSPATQVRMGAAAS